MTNYEKNQEEFLKLSKLKSDFRNFKLSIVTGDYKANIYPSKIPSDKMNFILSTFPNSIITGSIALSMYGLLNRNFSDFDIIIDNKNLYPSYIKDRYGDEGLYDNRLGYRNFKYKSNFFSKTQTYKVDFFENNGVGFNEFEVNGRLYKIQNLLEIISHKVNMAMSDSSNSSNSNKHFKDLQSIFYNANLETINNYKPSTFNL